MKYIILFSTFVSGCINNGYTFQNNIIMNTRFYQDSFENLPEETKEFIEPYSYIDNLDEECPNRCFEYCNFLVDYIVQSSNVASSARLIRQCAGFWFHGNRTHYTCHFKIGNEQYPPSYQSINSIQGNIPTGSYYRVMYSQPPPPITTITPEPPPMPNTPPPTLQRDNSVRNCKRL